MNDVHSLTGAYAIDALDDIERAQFERHLAGCPDCQAEVDSLREAGALLADTVATEPPTSLRDGVLGAIGTVRPLPPVTAERAAATDAPLDQPLELRRQPRWPGRRLRYLAAAAAAVVAVGGGAAIVQPWDDEPSDAPQLTATERVLQSDDAERFRQEFPGGATATLVRSRELNQAVLLTDDMPPAPEDHSYTLWLQHDDDMVPAGVMPSGPDQAVVLDGDAATADGAGITVEREGEQPPEPEGEVVALFEFA